MTSTILVPERMQQLFERQQLFAMKGFGFFLKQVTKTYFQNLTGMQLAN